MTETTVIDRPTPSRSTKTKASTVSVSALSRHLDCSQAYVRKLEAEGVLQRIGTGFALDASRVAYLRFLRRERKQSARGEADVAFTSAKTKLMQLRIDERERVLMPTDEAMSMIDEICGVFRTELSSLAARIAGRDLVERRRIDKLCNEMLRKIADAANMRAEELEREPNNDEVLEEDDAS